MQFLIELVVFLFVIGCFAAIFFRSVPARTDSNPCLVWQWRVIEVDGSYLLQGRSLFFRAIYFSARTWKWNSNRCAAHEFPTAEAAKSNIPMPNACGKVVYSQSTRFGLNRLGRWLAEI